MRPSIADVFDRLAHADGIDCWRGSKSANGNWNVITPSGAVDDVCKQKGPTLFLCKPTLELPAHQRVQLAVLVYRPVYASKEATLFE